MLNELQGAELHGNVERVLRKYTSPALLVVDDFAVLEWTLRRPSSPFRSSPIATSDVARPASRRTDPSRTGRRSSRTRSTPRSSPSASPRRPRSTSWGRAIDIRAPRSPSRRNSARRRRVSRCECPTRSRGEWCASRSAETATDGRMDPGDLGGTGRELHRWRRLVAEELEAQLGPLTVPNVAHEPPPSR
jgi:hypothetical protein